jgi:hypothetical protein
MRGESVCRVAGAVAGVVLMAGWAAAAPIEVTFTAEREQSAFLQIPAESAAAEEPERLLVRLRYDSTATPTIIPIEDVQFQHYVMTGMTVAVIGGSGFVEYAVDGRPATFGRPPLNATGMYVTNDHRGPQIAMAEKIEPQKQGLIGVLGEITLPLFGAQGATIEITSKYNSLPEDAAPLVQDWLALLAGDDAYGQVTIGIGGAESALRGSGIYLIDLGSVVVVPEPSLAATVMGLALLLRRRRACGRAASQA